MENNKIGFVILHYNTYNDTINCINSIINNIDTNNYSIIVVDNYSPNGSVAILKEKYLGNKDVHIISCKQNLGFANGNNMGINYAVEKLNCNFVCCLNNDTKIIQKDFFSIVLQEYERSKFALMGPKIILNNNKINPVNIDYVISAKRIRREIWIARIAYILTILYIGEVIKKIKFLQKSEKTNDSKDRKYENIMLHGCCLIFSPTFFEKLKGFNTQTFMFREEEFLFLEVMENNLKTVYNPKLLIRHYEDSATDSVFLSSRKKSLFSLKYNIDSSKKLLKYLKKLEGEKNEVY